jgi:uncharacterized membrane protein YgcG
MNRRTSTLVSAGVAGVLALSALGVAPAHAVETVIFSEDFESCTSAQSTPFDPIDGVDNEPFPSTDGNIDRTSTAKALATPISVQLFIGTLSCAGWTPRSQAWLTVKDGGANSGPDFPSGTKAVWLNEGGPSGGITRTVTGLSAGNTYRVSVKAWTDNADGATALGVNIGGGTTANMNLVMAAGSGIQTVQTEFCSTSTSITVDAFENGATPASPVIDDFTVTDLGISCSTFFALTPASSSISGTVGSPITPLTFTPTGLRGAVTYSAVGLPAGLSINPSTGVVSGTPLAGQAELSYTITAQGSDSGVASTAVTITISEGSGGGGSGGGGSGGGGSGGGGSGGGGSGGGGSGGSDSGAASSGLPNTGTSLAIVGITLGSAVLLYIFALFIFRGRRQLGFAAVNEKVSARMRELDAMLTRMEERARRRRIRRRS